MPDQYWSALDAEAELLGIPVSELVRLYVWRMLFPQEPKAFPKDAD